MKHFIITACVVFHTPLPVKDPNAECSSVAGYYANFGVTAERTESAAAMVSDLVKDGLVDWNDSTVREIDLQTFDEEIASQCRKPTERGIWYRSGRAIFPADSESPSHS